MNDLYRALLAALLLVLAGGCAESPPAALPTQTLLLLTDTPTPRPADATATPDLPAPVEAATLPAPSSSEQAQALVSRVVADLAGDLNVPSEQIQPYSVEAVTWPDASLGCGQVEETEAEPDLGAGVAGYRITLAYGGQVYEYHTDSGSLFRLCHADGAAEAGEPVILDPVLNSLVDLARRDLAAEFDLPVRRVFVVSVAPYEWPDTSLGCPNPEEAYETLPVPGYRILLRLGQQDYYYHSNYLQVLRCPEGREVLPALGPTPTPTPTDS